MRNLTILGATGSIGKNTLTVVDRFPDQFSVKALTARNNIALLAEQIKRFSPELAVVYSEIDAFELKELLLPDNRTEIMYGEKGYRAAAVHQDVDTVVSAVVGAAGLLPTLAAISAGKHIALANKETLVMAGDIVMSQAKQNNVSILPVDSEHSAIFQCLVGNRKKDLKKILLTASGGPFRNLPADQFKSITPEKALAHPTWEMGEKISIDSATLMNKGLEVIEAKHLFDVSHQKIEVVIHPQSIIHSMVSYIDGSVIAQLGTPDMKGAIAYALSCPERLPLNLPPPDFAGIGALTFEPPDMKKFPCLALAFFACETGGTLPCVLNAANEVAVDAFLNKRIGFIQIPEVIDHTMEKHRMITAPEIDDILLADQWARKTAEQWIVLSEDKGSV
ncbi:MAG: 1-deoxy-D-xylulose-5-phosphate reductoisomerase [Desulfobacteraceae bacterium]|nr:1-deoxy-D-xylulose-5-phosphate reductoisomerase [Desulfobacteraceae bacterium]MBC2754537.1 1-deoxy-D-xylulose-5-phosphate reductoisomerase [Desulfobacteraceae bacterium]MBC2763798.1 1-deoxy-D-xylulose-5-phosphate reductoisomerase [ANME-2 cluster archaeon]